MTDTVGAEAGSHSDSGIPLASTYRPSDGGSRNYERELGDPGSFPYTRGQRAGDPTAGWIQRELSGEGSPRRSNEQFHRLLAQGATGLDVIGDTPTYTMLDPDHPMAKPAVGSAGVSICRRQDFVELYDGIPLEQITASQSLPPAFAIAGIYLCARERGLDPRVLRGSAINPPLYGEDSSYSVFMPVELRLRMSLDAIVFSMREMPRFHHFIEDTYYIADGGLNAVEEMALGFIEIREITRRLIARGHHVDEFAPRIAILVDCRMDIFEEIAKIRATRRLFARMMRDEFGATDPRSLAVNVTVHTSGMSLTAQQPINNVIRGAIQALTAAMAGVNAVEISTFDEPFRTPSHTAHLVAMRTQQVIAEETGVARVADPIGGSWYVEHLTDELERRIDAEVRRIESLGEIADLVQSGFFRTIMHSGMDRYAREVLDGERRVVGVNCHPAIGDEDELLRDIAELRFESDDSHIERIREWKTTRNLRQVEHALDQVRAAGDDRSADLMAPIVAALNADATTGEIAFVLRESYGQPGDPFA